MSIFEINRLIYGPIYIYQANIYDQQRTFDNPRQYIAWDVSYLKLRFKVSEKNSRDNSPNSSAVYTKNSYEVPISWRLNFWWWGSCTCHYGQLLGLLKMELIDTNFLCLKKCLCMVRNGWNLYIYTYMSISACALKFNKFYFIFWHEK